jgi:hypothetical protein
MGNVCIFYGHLEYITAIWYILCPFGNLVVVWYILPHFGIFCQEKSGIIARQWLSKHVFCRTERIRNERRFSPTHVVIAGLPDFLVQYTNTVKIYQIMKKY